MKLIQTKDSSYTYHSEEYDETYHSTSGALEEAQKKFIEPCEIKDGLTILDIGFGLGYNVGMAIYNAKNLKIISLEKNIPDLDNINVPDWFKETYEKIKSCAKNLSYKDEETDIKIIIGDAKETIKEINEKFDAVFLDPFSPKKNQELWTEEFFKEIKKLMKKEAILATYSCAGVVRRNLKAAGFEVKDGPIVGRRSPGTLAMTKHF